MENTLWWTSTPSIRHTHGGSNTSLECTYHLSVSVNREQACELTSLYEIQYSTFTDTGIGSSDNSRLSVQPGCAAIPWASNHSWIPLWFLPQQTLMAKWSALTAQCALHSAVQRTRRRPRNISRKPCCVIQSLFLSPSNSALQHSPHTSMQTAKGNYNALLIRAIKC